MKLGILGTEYKIYFGETDGDADGHCCAIDLEIVLSDRLRENTQHCWRVLAHEIGHAFANEAGLSDYMNKREQECFAQTFSNLICGVFEPTKEMQDLLAPLPKVAASKSKALKKGRKRK